MVHLRKRLIVFMGAALMLASCASSPAPRSQATQAPEAAAEAPVAAAPIPADCPLAKIVKGMGLKEITDLIGPPTDTNHYATGKAFIPFYFGDDHVRTELHYKGMGRIIMWGGAYGGNPSVMEVIYDPKEPGYVRR